MKGGYRWLKKWGDEVNRSFEGGLKVAKVTKPRTGAKGKKTLEFENESSAC